MVLPITCVSSRENVDVVKMNSDLSGAEKIPRPCIPQMHAALEANIELCIDGKGARRQVH